MIGTFIKWVDNDFTNYLAGGYWIHADTATSGQLSCGFVYVNSRNFRFRILPESSTIGPVTQSTEIFPTGRPARTSRFYVYPEEIV